MTGGWALPACAAAFWAGILLVGERVPPAGGLALVAAGAGALAGAVLARRREAGMLGPAGLLRPAPTLGPAERMLSGLSVEDGSPGPPPEPARTAWLRVLALVAGFALIGAGWSSVRPQAVSSAGSIDATRLGFDAVVASDPRVFPFGWGAEARLERIRVGRRTYGVGLRVWLDGRARPPPLEPGSPVRGSGTVEALARGESGFADHLLDRGVGATLRLGELEVLGPVRNPALRVANAARRALRRGAERALPAREAGLLLGLAVGDTATLDAEVEEDFRATGLGHLLAVSGSNVAMFLAPVLGLALLFRMGAAGRFAIGVGAIVFFAMLTRWEPSVLRASVMAVFALLGVLAGRPRSTLALLGGAVLLLLALDPGLARAVGFQLSVAATTGLAAFAGPIAERLSRLPRPLALAMAATAAAQAGVTPLLLLRFGVVPVVTLVANVLAFPAVPLALFGGLVASGLGLVSPGLGAAVGKVAVWPISYLVGLADRMARAPLPSLTAGGLLGPLLAFAAVLLLAWRLRRRTRRAETATATATATAGPRATGPRLRAPAALLAAALLWALTVRAGPPDELTVTFLDVGQGDAAVVRTPDGATVLIDAGPDEQPVATALARLGVKRLDLAVATHAHADHVEGFPAVLARFPVGLFLEPGCEAESPSQAELLRALRDEDVRVHHPRGGERLQVGGLSVEVLGPDACGLGDVPNDDSIVVRLRYGEATVLFPGDAEVPAQQDALADGDPVRALVLKVPHHGGDTSDPAFFHATGARLAVVSVGKNDYGHPNPVAMAALRDAGMRIVRTDLAGDVTVRFAEGGILVTSER